MIETNAALSCFKPSAHERRQLSVAGLGLDERTIDRAYRDPRRVRPSSLRRLAAAAKAVGLPGPPMQART